MKNSFVKSFMIIGSGTLLNMLISLITTPIITRLIDPVEYGQLSMFNLYSNVAVMVLCMGLDQALVRYYYQSEAIEYKRALLLKCIVLPVFISLTLSILLIFSVYFNIVNLEFQPLVIIFLCVYTVIQLIYRFSILVVRLEYKSKLFSMLNVANKVLYVSLIIPLVLLVKNYYFLLLVISTILATFICMFISIIAQEENWKLWKNNNDFNINSRELIRYGLPYILSMGITTIFQATDRLALNYYCSYYVVGVYSSAMSLVSIFAIIQLTFNTLWAPISVEHYETKPEDKDFYQNANQIITVIMFFIGFSLILGKDLFVILLGPQYREAAYILPFLIFIPIMYTISETTVSGIVFMKKSRLHVFIALGACIVNAIGNIYIVPVYGGKGSAISTGIAYIVFFSLRTYFSNRYYYIDFKLKKFYLLTFVTILYALYNTFVPYNTFSIIGYLLCVIVLWVLYKETIVNGIRILISSIRTISQKEKGM